MSLITLATRSGAGSFKDLLWLSFPILLQIAHASQTIDGAEMKWIAADETETLKTLEIIQQFSQPGKNANV